MYGGGVMYNLRSKVTWFEPALYRRGSKSGCSSCSTTRHDRRALSQRAQTVTLVGCATLVALVEALLIVVALPCLLVEVIQVSVLVGRGLPAGQANRVGNDK